jgi:hypothetical protein
MEVFPEMKKYHTGKTEDGKDQFNIPINLDEDGMIGRECPNEDCQPKYFKVGMTVSDELAEKIGNFSQAQVTCPYCGTVDNMQHFLTEAQVEWVKSMMFRDLARTVDNMFKGVFKPTPSRSQGMFSISMKYKSGSLPSVRHYAEEKLKRIVACDKCGFKYAVYGISFHCPICGEGNLSRHLDRSAETINVLIEESDRIGRERGSPVGQHMIGNALEDVVGLFETFLKHVYAHEVKKRYPKTEAETKLEKVRNTFQRIEGGEKLFKDELGQYLYSSITANEKEFLEAEFLKRHVLTHNLGLVDRKYQEKAQTYQRQGAELELKPEEVKTALELVTRIIKGATQKAPSQATALP